MTRNKKIVAAVVILAALIAGAWSFGLLGPKVPAAKQGPDSKERVTLKYIINNLGGITAIDIALEKGFLAEQGIDIETVGVAGGGAASIQAILGGSADIGGAATPAYINAIKAGGKLKVIYGAGAMAHAKDPGYLWIVRENSGIKGPQDLVGKTIAMGARGAMWEYGTREYLKKAGLSIDQVTILIVAQPQHEQVLKSNQVDVVVGGPPFADHILDSGGAKELTNLYEILGEKIASGGYGSIVRQELIEKRPDVVRRLVAAYVKADQWAEANPAEAQKVVASILQKRQQSPLIAKYWKAPHLRDYGMWNDDDVNFWLDWFVKDGKIKPGEIKPADVYTNEFNPYYKK
jgi:ABC-type nitrate/sulfonate/bicarbonate transport system substrate-binding protein